MSNSSTEDQSGDDIVCIMSPSFSSYSSDRIAEIAARVAEENSSDGDGADEFEFAFVRGDDGELEVLADDFFRDGRIRQVFPVTNRDPRSACAGRDPPDSSACAGRDPPDSSACAVSLSKLFVEEDMRECDYSCSSTSSEVDDELERTYCVWRPKAEEDNPIPSQCEKSKSAGSGSSRWNIRGLVRRTRSDGEGDFVFLTPKVSKLGKSTGAPNRGGRRVGFRSAHEEFYVRNKAKKERDKRKSYLPYRQGLVGFFSNVNGLSGSNLAHF